MYPRKKNKTKQNKQTKSSLYTRRLVSKAIFDTYTIGEELVSDTLNFLNGGIFLFNNVKLVWS